jgi:hypothetical protein
MRICTYIHIAYNQYCNQKEEPLHNMKKENNFGSKYISVHANNDNSWSASNRGIKAEQTVNEEKYLMYGAGTRGPTVSKTDGQNLKPR